MDAEKNPGELTFTMTGDVHMPQLVSWSFVDHPSLSELRRESLRMQVFHLNQEAMKDYQRRIQQYYSE